MLTNDLELGHLLNARADATRRRAVTTDRDQHVAAHAAADREQRTLYGRDAAGSAERRSGRKAQVGYTEIRDKVFGYDRRIRVWNNAVDFLGTEPRIRNRIQRSLELKRKYALARHARVLGLSH